MESAKLLQDNWATTRQLTDSEKVDIAIEAVDQIWRNKGYDYAMPVIHDFLCHLYDSGLQPPQNRDGLEMEWCVSFEVLTLDRNPDFITLGEHHHDPVKATTAEEAISKGKDVLALVIEPCCKVICRGAWPSTYLENVETVD